MTEVVVTGMGAVTPLGAGVETLWQGLLAGRPTAGRITAFDPTGFPVTFACEVPDGVGVPPLPRRALRQTDRFSRFALTAAEEALRQADLLDADGALHGADPVRVAVVVASSIGGIRTMTTQHERLVIDGPDRVSPYLAVAMPLNLGGGQVAIRHGLRGHVVSPVSACASAADALLLARDLLLLDRADVVVAGGAEASIDPLTMAGFGAAGALSRRNDDPPHASRPFDVARDGFVMGEGAGILVLERAAHAHDRGAAVLAGLVGAGATNDAHHPSAPSPTAEGATRAIAQALRDADLSPADVGHVNAHGTSTPANDRAEALALHQALGPVADEVPVTSIKSTIGHLLGAAGAVEAIAAVEALRTGAVPPTSNLVDQDDACPVRVVTGAAGPVAAGTTALSNSFGFGGHNVVLALSAP